MDMSDWLLIMVGIATGYLLAKRAGTPSPALPLQQASGVQLSAGDKLNPGGAAQQGTDPLIATGINLLGNLNAAPGGTDPYATIFSQAIPSAG